MHSRSHSGPLPGRPDLSLHTSVQGGCTETHPPRPPRQQGVFQTQAELLGRASWQDRGAWRPTWGQSPHCAAGWWGLRLVGKAVWGPEPGQEGRGWVSRSSLWSFQREAPGGAWGTGQDSRGMGQHGNTSRLSGLQGASSLSAPGASLWPLRQEDHR